MKKIFCRFELILFLFVIAGAANAIDPFGNAYAEEKSQMYTAYNIWRLSWHNMKCINYKARNKFIPAGTKVRDIKIDILNRAHPTQRREVISFKIEGENWPIRIGFTRRYHPGKKIKDYLELMFTNKSFSGLTEGMTERELSAIQKGILVEGMSKKAVLTSYGYPPEHYTKSLDSDTWYYWMKKTQRKKICFDEYGRTVRCEKRVEEAL